MATSPFFVKSKLKVKNTSADTYAATVENAAFGGDKTFVLPAVTAASVTVAQITEAQTFAGVQTFSATPVFSTGILSGTTLKASGAAGIVFKENGDITRGSFDDSGLWSLGSVGDSQEHAINGRLNVYAEEGVLDSGLRLFSTTTGGLVKVERWRFTNTFASTNRLDILSVAGGTTVAQCTQAGAWSFPVSVASPVFNITNGAQKTTVTRSATAADYTLAAQDRSGYIADLQNLQDAAADKPSYRLDGVSDEITVPTNALLNVGGSEITLIISAVSNSVTESAFRYLGYLYNATDVFPMLFQRKTSSGIIQVQQGSSTVDTAAVITAGNPFTFACSRTATAIQPYLNGVALAAVNQTLYPATVATQFSIGSTSATNSWLGNVSRSLLFNYTLSADKIARYSAGAKLDWEDIGGSMTPINNVAADQDFSSDTGYWTKNAAVAITTEKVLFNNVSAITDGLTKANVLTVGKIYKIKFTVSGYGTGGIFPYTNNYDVIYVSKDGVSQSLSQEANSDGTWVYYVRPKGVNLYIQSGSATTYLFIDDLTVIPLGCVLDLEPEGITSNKWLDSSTNLLHGAVTGAVVTNAPALTTGEFTSTATSVLNCASTPTVAVSRYQRVGNIVSVQSKGSVDPTAAGTTIFTLSLPIASALTGADQLTGVGIALEGSIHLGIRVIGNVAGDKAEIYVYPTGTDAMEFFVDYSYNILA